MFMISSFKLVNVLFDFAVLKSTGVNRKSNEPIEPFIKNRSTYFNSLSVLDVTKESLFNF